MIHDFTCFLFVLIDIVQILFEEKKSSFLTSDKCENAAAFSAETDADNCVVSSNKARTRMLSAAR